MAKGKGITMGENADNALSEPELGVSEEAHKGKPSPEVKKEDSLPNSEPPDNSADDGTIEVRPNTNSRQKLVDDIRALFLFRQDEDKHLWRKQYLQKSFYLVGFVLYFSLFVVLLVGVGLLDLTQGVLMSLLGSTVAEVIGILLVAFNWLYPKPTDGNQKYRKGGRK